MGPNGQKSHGMYFILGESVKDKQICLLDTGQQIICSIQYSKGAFQTPTFALYISVRIPGTRK